MKTGSSLFVLAAFVASVAGQAQDSLVDVAVNSTSFAVGAGLIESPAKFSASCDVTEGSLKVLAPVEDGCGRLVTLSNDGLVVNATIVGTNTSLVLDTATFDALNITGPTNITWGFADEVSRLVEAFAVPETVFVTVYATATTTSTTTHAAATTTTVSSKPFTTHNNVAAASSPATTTVRTTVQETTTTTVEPEPTTTTTSPSVPTTTQSLEETTTTTTKASTTTTAAQETTTTTRAPVTTTQSWTTVIRSTTTTTTEAPTTTVRTTTTTVRPTTTVETTTASPSPTSGNGGGYSGKATYYFQYGAYGACGKINPDSAYIVALPAGYYQNGASCGRTLRISNSSGKTITASVADLCPGCSGNHIDLSAGAYDALGPRSAGVLPITWSFA